MNRLIHPLGTAFIAALIFLTSCVERELPIPARTPGSANLIQANVGVDYETQLFFSLTENRIEASCQQRDWCIALREAEGATSLMTNSGRAMKTYHTEAIDFHSSINFDALEDDKWEVMDPTGMAGNANVGLELVANELTLVDLGLDEENEPLGIARVGLIGLDDTGWLLQIADAQGVNTDTVSVPKLDGCEWHQVSLLNSSAHQVEPPASAWEVCITQYMELLDGEIPYLVVGLLTPTDRVQVYETREVDWETWKTNSWDDLEFSPEWNAIGYDWKIFDLSTSAYTVDYDKLYCVRTEEGREFLMRMLDFYDANGNTGNVTFEVLER
ncbi:HmuY family protein [Flavobacteriales bacterium]|nr:HmuY family protein [Flavobacteriales bacterium]